MSPVLFTIGAGAIETLFMKAKEIGLIGEYEVGRNGEEINYTLWTTPSYLVWLEPRRKRMTSLKRVLIHFEPFLGLKVNLSKSMVVGSGVFEEDCLIKICRLSGYGGLRKKKKLCSEGLMLLNMVRVIAFTPP